MKVLFDTNAVVYWSDDVPRFRPSLHAFFLGLGAGPASFIVSAVTIHEISCFQIRNGTWSKGEKFISERFQIVAFDDPTARRAGELWAKHHSASTKLDWHRDTAIAATAISIGANVLVTAEDFSRYAPSLGECRVARLV